MTDTTDVNVKMQKGSDEIDKFIRKANANKYYNYPEIEKLWQKISDIAAEAGSSGTIHPAEGLKWLQEQSKKLIDFLSRWIIENTTKKK